MEKFQIFVKNLNNLWSFIEIYAAFVLNLCGENLCGEKMTNMRSVHIVPNRGNEPVERLLFREGALFHIIPELETT